MKPAWDKLAESYLASSTVVVADVDCTGAGKPLCDKNEVRGYPTIKYFTDETGPGGADYSGGRTFEDLDKFVADNLSAKCLIDDTEACTEKELAFMEKWKPKAKDDVKAQITRLEKVSEGSMKPELKAWVSQRLAILRQL